MDKKGEQTTTIPTPDQVLETPGQVQQINTKGGDMESNYDEDMT